MAFLATGQLPSLAEWIAEAQKGAVKGWMEERAATGGPKAAWCSPANAHERCTPIPGLCKAMTWEALADYKALQTALNRIAYSKGWSLIAIDGRIGPATVSLGNRAMGSNWGSCDPFALNAKKWAAELNAIATRVGAPAAVTPPKPSAPASQPSPGGGVINPVTPKAAGVGTFQQLAGFATSPLGLALLGGALLWYFDPFGWKKPRRNPSGRRRNPKTTKPWRMTYRYLSPTYKRWVQKTSSYPTKGEAEHAAHWMRSGGHRGVKVYRV
jgi:hypothetical protein